MKDKKKAINIVILTVMVGFICYSLPYPVFSPMFLKDNGILPDFSPERRMLLFGITMALYPLGQIIGGPIVGKISDIHGRRPVLVVSLAGAAISCVILTYSMYTSNLPLLMFGRFLNGLFESNISVAQSIAADISTESNKTKNFSLISIAMNCGWIVGPIVGGKLSDCTIVSWFSYTTPFFVVIFLTLFNLAMVMFFLPETLKKEQSPQKKQPEGYSMVLKNINLKKIYLLTFISYFAIFMFFCFYPCFYVKRFGATPGEFANYSAFISLPMIATAYIIPLLEKKVSSRITGMAGHLLMTAGFLIFLLCDTAFSTVIPICLAGFGITTSELATSLAVSNNASVEIQGRALGLYRSLSVFAESMAALLGGVFAAFYYGLPFIIAALIAIPCGLYFILDRKLRVF